MDENSADVAALLAAVTDFPDEVAALLTAVGFELATARAVFHPFSSGHEGIAVIEEEYLELRAHVYTDTARTPEARAEAIQLAAMACRFVLDLQDPDDRVPSARTPKA